MVRHAMGIRVRQLRAHLSDRFVEGSVDWPADDERAAAVHVRAVSTRLSMFVGHEFSGGDHLRLQHL